MALKCYWKLALIAGGAVTATSAQAGEMISYTCDVHGRVTHAAYSGTVNNGVGTNAPDSSGDPALAATAASEMQSESVPTDPLPGPS